jgi:hypothetical protein
MKNHPSRNCVSYLEGSLPCPDCMSTDQEIDFWKNRCERAFIAAKKTAENMEEMERDLYIRLADKEEESETYRDLLQDAIEVLLGQSDSEDSLAMIKKIESVLKESAK